MLCKGRVGRVTIKRKSLRSGDIILQKIVHAPALSKERFTRNEPAKMNDSDLKSCNKLDYSPPQLGCVWFNENKLSLVYD